MTQPVGTMTTITGTIEAINDRGIKVSGGRLNTSKFHTMPQPMRGARVPVEVQGERRSCAMKHGMAPALPRG